jgi:hypothetical protein
MGRLFGGKTKMEMTVALNAVLFPAILSILVLSEKSFVINCRVDNLETLLKELAEKGVTIVGDM